MQLAGQVCVCLQLTGLLQWMRFSEVVCVKGIAICAV